MSDDKTEGTKNGDQATPKEEPSPTVSHSEPSAVHSEQAVPPLAKADDAHKHDPAVHAHDSHGHDSHGHDSHGHDSHGHDSHGGHGDAPAVADFGEVIPEKNWQDSFLASIAFCVLGGFIWLGLIWAQVPEPPAEAAHPAEAQEEPAPHLTGPPPSAAPTINPKDMPDGPPKITPAMDKAPAPSRNPAAATGHETKIQTAPKTPDNTKVRNSSQF